MFTVFGGAKQYCDGLTRRGFLEVGAVGLCGLTMADFLRADARAAGASSPDREYRTKSFINIYLGGGPSHMETFDPKPLAPVEFRGEFHAIDTAVPGIQICEHLPLLARQMDKLAIIRSLTGIVDEHHYSQTESGWSERSLNSAGGRPSLGAVLSRVHGTSNGEAPTFVDLSGQTRTGFLGPMYGGFRTEGEGRDNLRLQGSVSVSRLDDRQKLLGGLDRLKAQVAASSTMQAIDSFKQRAVDVILSGTMARALNLEAEDPRVRNRYTYGPRGSDQYRDNERFLLARRLVQSGVRCVSLAWGGWDTHERNFIHLKQQLPAFDLGVSSLIEDLDDHGLLQDTVVAVWGEFGRTPRVNNNAGRDHWPRAASVLLAGGGFRMGQVIGATNRLGEEPKERPVHLHEVFATLYQHLGIDPKYTTLVDNNGRPQYLVENPAPVHELLA